MTNPAPSPEAEALPTLPVVAWQWRKRLNQGDYNGAPYYCWTEWEALQPPYMDARDLAYTDPENYQIRPVALQAPAEAAIVALRAEVAELRKERDAAAQDLSSLRAFVGEVMGDWPDVGGLDGFDLQGIGEKTGLLRRETRVAPCGEQCACVEFDSGEVECWRVEPVLQRARASLLGDGGTL